MGEIKQIKAEFVQQRVCLEVKSENAIRLFVIYPWDNYYSTLD